MCAPIDPPVTVCHTLHLVYLFIMNKQRQYTYVGVGDMKDYKLKLRNLRVSHTLTHVYVQYGS